MANKRRKSRSPDPVVAVKRIRRLSAHSAHRAHNPQADRSRVKSASVDDWAFRVSVISSATDIDNAIFTQAVQGLVKICFPDGILDELGVELLEQYMRTENAPEANIVKMHEVFRAEMAHRVIWMLAEYLDSPARIEAGVESIIAASAAVHGSKLGNDVLDKIVTNLRHLRERVPTDSTRLLSDGAAIRETTASNSNDTSDSELSASEETINQPRKKKTQNKARGRSSMQGVASDEVPIDVDDQATQADQRAVTSSVPTPAARMNKISSSWIWNIDAEDILTVNIRDHFTTMADLFAYHALPIAKKVLGPLARRKEIRHKMESMLSDTSDTEHEKWVESFEKLLAEDREMLVRADAQSSTERRGFDATTPAPVEMRRVVKRTAERAVIGFKPTRGQSGGVSARVADKYPIKKEHNTAIKGIAKQPQVEQSGDGMTATVEAFRYLSTEQQDPDQPVASIERTSKLDAGGVNKAAKTPGTANFGFIAGHVGQEAQNKELATETPVVELLYGSGALEPNNIDEIAQTIMDNLNQRGSIDSVGVMQNDGTTKIESKSHLASALMKVSGVRHPGRITTPLALRRIYESKLSFWVAANPSAFPELHTFPVMFTHILGCQTLVSDLLFDPSWPMPTNRVQRDEMISYIITSLKQRDILNDYGAQVMVKRCSDQLRHAITIQMGKHIETVNRIIIERILRTLAFHNRCKFPELKGSFVVRTWERMTGQRCNHRPWDLIWAVRAK